MFTIELHGSENFADLDQGVISFSFHFVIMRFKMSHNAEAFFYEVRGQ